MIQTEAALRWPPVWDTDPDDGERYVNPPELEGFIEEISALTYDGMPTAYLIQFAVPFWRAGENVPPHVIVEHEGELEEKVRVLRRWFDGGLKPAG